MKVMKVIKAIITFIFAYISLHLSGQHLIGLEYNHSIKIEIEKTKGINLKEANGNPVAPPIPDDCLFFDDFSYYGQSVFPDQNIWSDKYAFINQTYPDSCISIGVATLDAIDEKGDIYAINDSPTKSDTLTSREIDLTVSTKNLYFLFFLQGGGKGDSPDDYDTLIVEFYANR